MNARQIHEEGGEETFVLESGDEMVSEISGFARENGVDAASLTAIAGHLKKRTDQATGLALISPGD